MILPLLAAGAWGGTSYYAGTQIKPAYDYVLSEANQFGPLVFERQSLDQGLISSEAVTVVKESDAPDAEIVLRLAHEINHSSVQLDNGKPAVASATVRTTLVEGSVNEKYQSLRDAFTGKVPFEIINMINASGHKSSEITLSDFTYPLSTEEIAAVAGGTLSVTGDADRVNGDGKLGAVTVTSTDGSSAEISPIAMAFDLAPKNTWTSEYRIDLETEAMTLQPPGQNTSITANGLQLLSKSTVDDDQIDFLSTFSIDELDPGITPSIDTAPVTSGTLEMALNNFSIRELRIFDSAIQPYYDEGLQDSAEFNTANFLGEYLRLATPDVGFSFKLDLNNSAGNANAQASLVFLGDQSSTGRKSIVTGVDLANALQLKAEVVADKAAVALTPAGALMQTPPAAMVFEERGDQWVSSLEAIGITAELNGEPLPLEQWAGGFLAMPLEDLLSLTP